MTNKPNDPESNRALLACIAARHEARLSAAPEDIGRTFYVYGRVYDGGQLYVLLAAPTGARLLLQQPTTLAVLPNQAKVTITAQLEVQRMPAPRRPKAFSHAR